MFVDCNCWQTWWLEDGCSLCALVEGFLWFLAVDRHLLFDTSLSLVYCHQYAQQAIGMINSVPKSTNYDPLNSYSLLHYLDFTSGVFFTNSLSKFRHFKCIRTPKFRHTQLICDVIHFELIFSMLLKFRQPWYFGSLKLH